MQAYSTLHEWDHALFGRVSTVLQQADVSGFELRTIATIVQAYCHKEVCVCVCVLEPLHNYCLNLSLSCTN